MAHIGVMKNKSVFYILSWTWGLPMTLIGAVIASVLMALGYEPKQYGYCYYFEVGENWGGLELGMFFLVNKGASEYIKTHEYGHALQNCVYGIFTPFIISIPSAIRYHYRNAQENAGKPCTTGYYDIWFEKQASEWGEKFIDTIQND